MTRYDLVVIGGGVSGLWSAYFAGLKGLSVALVERKILGSGATGRAAGIVTVQLSLKVDVELAKRTLRHYSDLSKNSDGSAFFTQTGFLSIEPEWMARSSSSMLSNVNVHHEVLDKSEIEDICSDLRVEDHEVGVYTPLDGLIDAGSMVRTLKGELRELNVDVYERSSLQGVKSDGYEISSIRLSDSRELKLDHVVFASGAWCKSLLARAGLGELPLVVYSCQTMLVERPSNMRIIPTYFADSHLYWRAEGERAMIVGNGYAKVLDEADECRDVVEEEFVEEIVEKIIKRVKDPSSILIRGGWSGPCSSTPDGLPMVGKLPKMVNAYIIDGLNGYGLMRAPALANDLINGLTSGDLRELSMFEPSRFYGSRVSVERVIELHS